MRIRFRANNPGVWLFHCHTESHLDRGMAVMIHVSHEFSSTSRIPYQSIFDFQVAEDRLEQLLKSMCSFITINNQLVLFLSVLFILKAVQRNHSI
jgi:hypothetical protein